MRRLLFLGIFFFLAPAVRAYDLRLRAILPNPPGSDESEWIAVENVSPATISAQLYSLRDVYGSIKTFGLGSFLPLELKTILASQSGIMLNNTEEQIELLYLGQVVESSPRLVASQEGKVFIQLDSGWKEINEAEYRERQAGRNWSWLADVGREEPDEANPAVVQLPENAKREDGEEEISPNDDTVSIQRAFPKLLRGTSFLATPSGLLSWPIPPEPDYEREMDVFLGWKREALLGSLLLIFGGTCLISLTLPPVSDIWRWLREELLL